MKIALLSNVNTDFVLRLLARTYETVPSVGYGNIWGQLLDPASQLNSCDPKALFIIADIEDIVSGCTDRAQAFAAIDEWFGMLDTVLQNGREFFVSDVTFRTEQICDNDTFFETDIEEHWLGCLKSRIEKHNNIHLLGLNKAINKVGKSVFYSDKLWYMGKIPFSNKGTECAAEVISEAVTVLTRTPRKVLVLDLDNTLWGGILGEKGVEGIELSDDHLGALYKKVQSMIKMIQRSGAVLAVCSKNNVSDVDEVWDKHPHMLLKREDLVSVKINWEDKVSNIQSIADELNLGLDSFVFIDDMPSERENVKKRLPDVAVPDFPDKLEDYPAFINKVFDTYFKKTRMTAEDSKKTAQYKENINREKAAQGLSYEDFLKTLNLRAVRVEPDDVSMERIVQLIGKTNQFNLTTIRYSKQDIYRMLNDGYKLYAYNVSDEFGDYGIVAVIIVNMRVPLIDTFVMSCRIMGKQIENYFINEVEKDMAAMGYEKLGAKYIPTKKNIPVAHLYEDLGYNIISSADEETVYEIDLEKRPRRKFFVNEQRSI